MRVARAWLAAFLLCWTFAAIAQVAVPPLTGRVVDQTGILTSEAASRLEQKLRDFETRKGSQIAVLIVPSTQPEAIEQYSLRVAEQWKIGRKKIDDGAILLIAKNDRKLRIEVGYGLEGALNDVTAKRIIDEIITPKFKNGDFSGGIEDGVERMIGVIDGEPLPVPKPQHEWQDEGFDPSVLFNPVVIVGAAVVGGFMSSLFGALLGALLTSVVVGVIAWFILASWIAAIFISIIAFVVALISGASRSGGSGGGWSSGSSGGSWSSGSSSSGGGFSGGGGSFGGGGASGSW